MARPQIRDFIFDDENEIEFARHSISPKQVWQMLDHRFTLKRNRRKRRGLYLIIGRDDSGKCIAVPIESTGERGIWRPITAWPCKGSEKAPP